MEEGFRKDADTFLANRDPKIAEATTKTDEESRRSQEVITRLEMDLEASHAELERQREASQEVTAEAWEIAKAKKAAEAEAGSLRTANRVLEEENNELKAKPRFATGKLNTAYADLDSRNKRSEYLTAELEKVRGRLAELEAAMKKEARETRELVEFVDGRLEAWEE